MKLFPDKNVLIKLKGDRATSLNELRRNTKLTGKLMSEYTNKQFIGQVSDYGFKIISSEIGRSAVCVFIGDLQDSLGTLEIRLHTAFKILFSILMLLPIIGFAMAILINGIEGLMMTILPTIIGLLFVRFVFMELSFRFISNTGLNKLKKLIELEIVE